MFCNSRKSISVSAFSPLVLRLNVSFKRLPFSFSVPRLMDAVGWTNQKNWFRNWSLLEMVCSRQAALLAMPIFYIFQKSGRFYTCDLAWTLFDVKLRVRCDLTYTFYSYAVICRNSFDFSTKNYFRVLYQSANIFLNCCKYKTLWRKHEGSSRGETSVTEKREPVKFIGHRNCTDIATSRVSTDWMAAKPHRAPRRHWL